MKKSFLVLGMVVLACSLASAGSWSFGFLSVDGGGPYCNFEQINNNNTDGVAGLAGGAVYEGFDNLSACGVSYNATISGYGPYSLPKGVTFAGAKVTVTKGAVYGDNIYDAFSDAYTGEQWTVATALACSTKPPAKNKDWWIGVASFSDFVFGDNAGPLSCTLPSAGHHNGLLTTGQQK